MTIEMRSKKKVVVLKKVWRRSILMYMFKGNAGNRPATFGGKYSVVVTGGNVQSRTKSGLFGARFFVFPCSYVGMRYTLLGGAFER